MKKIALIFATVSMALQALSQSYEMPAEHLPHQGTWLQWPHQFEYGILYRNRLDATWVQMTSALVGSEKVHIVAYDAIEQSRIADLLTTAGVSLSQIDFLLAPTNDVWVRDNGPIFVRDTTGTLHIEDWGFNGWGGDYDYDLCDPIPAQIWTALSLPVLNLNAVMVMEGGSFELNGNGVFLATRSSILTQTNSGGALAIRNPGMTEPGAETILSQYLGVQKFIWLDGFLGPDDITDAHIDGFAKFADDTTLVTMSNADLAYWGLSSADIATLNAASNLAGEEYHKVYLPLTMNDVETTYGYNLGYKGSYCNYYIANSAVLVPNYNDPHDAIANAIIEGLHPGRTVIGIDCRNLYAYGGMVHCVTQQQPVATAGTGMAELVKDAIKVGQNFPNPFHESTTLPISLTQAATVQLDLYNALGQTMGAGQTYPLAAGSHTLRISAENLPSGAYTYKLTLDNQRVVSGRVMVVR